MLWAGALSSLPSLVVESQDGVRGTSPITPIQAPADAEGLLIFGGTFDPPTRAHVELALGARDRAAPKSWLVYVPAARSPHKQEGPLAPDADRVAMLRIALRDAHRACIWTDELDRADRGEPSYSLTTVERAHAARPSARLRVLIGADQAAAFHRWRDPRRIIEIAEPVVMLRKPSESADALMEDLERTGAWSRDDLDAWRARIAEVPVMGVSATEARDLLNSVRADDPRLADLLDQRVLDYIREHGLYTD